MNTLAFTQLEQANRERCEESFHPLKAWNALEWAGAMCGEAGEAANIAKKIKRHDTDSAPVRTSQERWAQMRRELVVALGREVADTVIYADLVLQREGLSLVEFIIMAFNDKSQEIGSSVYLRESPS